MMILLKTKNKNNKMKVPPSRNPKDNLKIINLSKI